MVRAHGPSIDAATWRALGASWLGWMFDGYETYALVLVAAVAVRQLVAGDQQAQLPLYIGGLLSATLVGWATGGVIAGILADYVGRKPMLMLSIFHIPPDLVVRGVTAQRNPPEVRIWTLRNQSRVGTRPPSTSTPHCPACWARR